MTKTDFIFELSERLSPLPWEEIEERLNFYIEMIDDRMEDGLSEEEAVASVGTAEEIVSQIVSDIPFTALVKDKVKSKQKRSAWQTAGIIAGFPIYFSLLAAAFAVLISVYAVLWSVIISFWAIFVTFAAVTLGCILLSVFLIITGSAAKGTAILGCGIFFAGLTILTFFLCKIISLGILLLSKKLALWIKFLFVGRERSK